MLVELDKSLQLYLENSKQ